VLAPKSLEELDDMAGGLRGQPPAVIAVHGGDGTLHRLVTALGRAFGDRPIPPIAILGGGTMNVVSASLHLRERAVPFVRQLVESVRTGAPFQTVRRRCLRIGDMLGFIFGNGLLANFLAEYYGTGRYGPARAAWLLLRAGGSALIGGPFIRKLFKRFEGTLELDGQVLDRTSFVGVGAATVREVGMGFKLNHRADDDPERFGFLAIHARPIAMIPDFVSVYVGRGMAPSRAMSAVASTLRITPKEGTMSYTIDGDLYRNEGPLVISMGPPLLFVRPAGALIVAPRSDTMVPTP
jgi:diacylglycerol kinase (ATP)